MKSFLVISTIIFDLAGVIFNFQPSDLTLALKQDVPSNPFSVFDQGLATVKRLKEKNFKVIACTNFGKGPMDLLNKYHKDVMDLFEDVITPSESKHSKPDARMYSYILKKHNVVAEECLFIDDCQSNAIGANDVGLNAIHLKNWEQAIKELKELGL
ncbi:HAD-IA family hydrolase [bacterium]|jgi:epoxide hydrolase-like predicted phosphatase|nr:HAD-IA family hydrolase [bacterium]